MGKQPPGQAGPRDGPRVDATHEGPTLRSSRAKMPSGPRSSSSVDVAALWGRLSNDGKTANNASSNAG
jgi:hypothetical protein